MIKYTLRFDIFHIISGDVGHITLYSNLLNLYKYQKASYYTDLTEYETNSLKTINQILIHGKEEEIDI